VTRTAGLGTDSSGRILIAGVITIYRYGHDLLFIDPRIPYMLFFKSSDVNPREEVIYILLPFPPEYTRTSYRTEKVTPLNSIGYRFVEYQITRRVSKGN
jgi:hypothetical protein